MAVNRTQQSNTYKHNSGKKNYTSNTGYGKKSNIGEKIVNIVMWLPNRFIDLVSFFIRGRGRGLIGLGIFFLGLFISVDAYWLSANPSMPSLIGFGVPDNKARLDFFGVLALFLSPYAGSLWASIFTSTVIQIIEGFVIRSSSSPTEAKSNLDYFSQFDSGNEPSGKINRAKVAHREYKNSGMMQYYLLSLVGLGCWVIDIIVAFQVNNPLDYWGNPMKVATTLGINLIKIFAAEAGFAIMLKLNGRG